MWKALGALAIGLAAVFFTFAVLHTGVATEPAMPPAVVVELLCGAGLAAGGYGALAVRSWAWNGLVRAYAGALGGVLLGILAVALVPGQGSSLTDWYHRSMAVVLALGLAGALYASRERK